MPYTYVLRNKITGEKYYGVRYAQGCDPSELWKTYFSSSKYVIQRIKEHGQTSFEFEVRKIFATAKAARDWEERVLRRLDILHRTDWLNRNVCGKFLRGGPKSPEHLKKIAEALKGHRGYRPSPSLEERATISKRFKGVPKTTEHVANLSVATHNSLRIVCFCGKEGPVSTMRRWHFENCGKKSKQLHCPHCDYVGRDPNIHRFHFDNCRRLSDLAQKQTSAVY